mmetsp:Transcript_32628/g.98272  ORF Transcript_32628/g.98272 Transcript_32628/m.98272 type:complete len:234 (-) Transcript_32628:503-1204(-)
MMNIFAISTLPVGCLARRFLIGKLLLAILCAHCISFPAWMEQLVIKKKPLLRYKHILGWPVTVADLEQLDADTYTNLCKLKDLDDVEVCCLDFTVTEDHWGTAQTVELKPDGASCAVTNSNVDEYIQLQMRYRLLDRVKEQVKALLLGFYDVIPEVLLELTSLRSLLAASSQALLSLFDFQELELLLCGLPEIDIQDWKRHTEYTGDYERKGASHKVVKWFWEVRTTNMLNSY